MTLDEITDEIRRLTALKAERQAAHDRDAAQHRSRWDERLQKHLVDEIAAIDRKVATLSERKLAVELGDAAPPAPKPVARARRAWSVEDVPEPAFPTDAFRRHDKEALQAGLDAYIRRGQNEAAKVGRDFGFDPDTPLSGEFAFDLFGTLKGWISYHIDALGDVVERLEAVEQRGLEFVGVHQRSVTYQQGHVVVHGGASWVALRQTRAGEIPGDAPSAWQLALKARPPATDPGKGVKAARDAPKKVKTTRVLEHDAQGRVKTFVTEEDA
jgi:hypothetical protein